MHSSLRALALTLLAATALPGCATEFDTSAYFPKSYASDYALITNCKLSQSHGGKYAKTYVTKDAEAAWKAKTHPFAEGVVFVKVLHNDSKCSDISGYSAMKKLALGTGGAAGDWSWQSLDADAQVTNVGQLSGCTSCHKKYKDNDFVATKP